MWPLRAGASRRMGVQIFAPNTMTFGVRQKTSGYDKTMVC
jgi:hypothetical protein